MLLANIVPEEKRLAHAAPNEPRSEALLVVGVICEEETVPKNEDSESQDKEQSVNVDSPKIPSVIKNSSNHKMFLISSVA